MLPVSKTIQANLPQKPYSASIRIFCSCKFRRSIIMQIKTTPILTIWQCFIARVGCAQFRLLFLQDYMDSYGLSSLFLHQICFDCMAIIIYYIHLLSFLSFCMQTWPFIDCVVCVWSVEARVSPIYWFNSNSISTLNFWIWQCVFKDYHGIQRNYFEIHATKLLLQIMQVSSKKILGYLKKIY